MRIIFVRHGHPDYAHDCLTELGHRHAAAAAERLRGEGIERVFSSTKGRAMETAAHTAEVFGLPVEGCDFMREITWGFGDGPVCGDEGNPWLAVRQMTECGESLLDPDWRQHPLFSGNRLVQSAEVVARGTDAWLETLGYTRDGLYYRMTGEPPRTVAAFGHGGESAALLSHLFNLPFPYVCTAMGPEYTGITIVRFPRERDCLLSPRFELMNDARHIRGLSVGNVYGN